MKTIEMTHKHTDGTVTTEYISHNQFKSSFVDERWSGERRTQKAMTCFGEYHHKTTVTSPSGLKSIRTFKFPRNYKHAEEIGLAQEVQA